MTAPRRHELLASEIHRALQAAIDRGVQDPRVSGMITITGVRITPDGAIAQVSVSVLPAEKQDLTMHGLKSAARHLRHVIGEVVRTRQMPELDFRLDQSLKKQAAVMDAIARATADRERREAARPQPPASPTEGNAYAQAPPPEDSPE